LADWPIGRQSNWVEWVNQPETEQELESLRKSVQRGRPFGGPLGRNRSPNGSDSNRRIGQLVTRGKSHNARYLAVRSLCGQAQVCLFYQYRTCPVFRPLHHTAACAVLLCALAL